MRRTKTPGVYCSGNSYEIDKVHKGERLRQRGFENFEDAQNWLVDEVARINEEKRHGRRQARTFSQAAEHYLYLYQEKASIESEIYHLQAVMPYIENLLLDQVHNGTLKDFKDARLAAGRKTKTINLSLGIVRHILNLAARDWRDENGRTWLLQAPLISMLPVTDQRPPRPIQWDQQRVLLPLLPDHLAKMSLFCLNTGARDNVLCNLQWEWEVPIKQLGVSAFVVPAAYVKGVAGKKTDRLIVCNSVAQSIIEGQRGKHATHVFVYRRERVKNLHLVPTMDYRPVTAMLNTAWCNAREKAGLGDLHVHDLRHTVGFRLREAGVDDRTQDDILWHKSRTMTAHYSMAQIVEIHAALEKITSESHRWNVSLASLIHEAKSARVPRKVPQEIKTA